MSSSRRRTRDDESTASAEAEEIIEDFDASMRFLDCIRWTARFVLPSMVTKTPANERSNTLDLDLSISVNEIAAVSSTPSNAASKVCGTSDGTPKTRTRKRKLSPQDNLVECSKEQASCSSNDTGSLAASLVSALLRMTAGVVATRTGTPALVSSATKFGCDALEKDSGLELVSACLTLAASCHRYMKVYGTQYAEYAQQTQPEGRQNFLQGTSLLPTNRPQFSVWHPDMSLFKACFASALRCLSSEDMASLSRALNNTLSALDGTGLSEVMQFCLRSCVALISLNQFKSAEEVSQSSTGALLGTLTTRASLARTTAAALRRVCGSSSRESADHQTALMVLLDYLQLHPGKVTERELNVALSVIDLELRNRSRTTRTTPVVLQQRQRGEALTESSSNMSSDCIEDEVSHPQKNSPEGRDTAGGHNKENISSSSNDSSSSLAA
ncbi:hypothetical protein FHG87_012296 [Trinorchestia longiramus]|nr:hypothetical protein FHG87_012296 [Trinorchestia longiramus]